jgi:hypothetical protein
MKKLRFALALLALSCFPALAQFKSGATNLPTVTTIGSGAYTITDAGAGSKNITLNNAVAEGLKGTTAKAGVAAIMATNNAATATTALNVPTNVFYLSMWPGVTKVPGATTNGGIGADSGPAIQALFDHVTNFPSGIEIIRDGEFITAQTLKIRSNTKLSALGWNCAIVLSNSVSQYLMVNEPLNGNVILCSNITLCNGSMNGNMASQNRYLTNGPYYDGIYSPIKGTNQVDYTVGVAEGATHWRPWCYNVWFSGVENLRVENELFKNSVQFALTLGNIKNGIIAGNRFQWDSALHASQDGVHIYTPQNNVVVRDNISNGTDDMLGFNTDELAYVTNANTRIWRGTNGGGSNFVFENNVRENGAGGFVRIISYSTTLGKNSFTNLVIRGLRGGIPASGWIAGAVNSIFTDQKTFIDGLTISDVKLTNQVASGLALANVNGTWLNISDVTGYGSPSFYNSFDLFSASRFTQGFISLDSGWDNVSVDNAAFNSLTNQTNVSLVSIKYPYSRKINHLRISDSSISGPGVRAVVANHGDIGTLALSGNSTTNSVWIPDVYTAKTITGGGTIGVGRVTGGTNYAEDTTLWLMRSRALGVEEPAHRVRAVDWGLQFLQDTGDLANIQEIGFFAGATNINQTLTKIRTYSTNQWSTNSYHINNGLDSADLSRFGLVGDGSGYFNTQVPITTAGIGAVATQTNFVFGVYLHTIATTNAATAFAGASYAASGDANRFSFDAYSPAFVNVPGVSIGNKFGRTAGLTNNLWTLTVSNSATTYSVRNAGVEVGASAEWNGQGFQAGTLNIMKGQYYPLSTNQIIPFWFLGSANINQSNVAYASRIMTEMAACYSPASLYASGWTNYFGGNASVFVTGGTSIGVTNQLGQTQLTLATATNVTVTLKPGWTIGGTAMSGTATDF